MFILSYPLTTPSRIRNRIEVSESDISDEVLQEFIEDETAYLEAYAGKELSDSALAAAICTDRCAIRALVRLIDLHSEGEIFVMDVSNKGIILSDLRRDVKSMMPLLKDKIHLKPKNTTS